MIIKYLRNSMAVICLTVSSALAVQPTAINDLNAVTGTATGSIDLSWTSPNEGGLAVQNYIIRYRANNPIGSQTEFNSALLYPSAPTPQTPGSLQQFTITNLTPGVLYYFSVISRGTDTANPFSALSNSPGATSGQACTVSPFDGDGSVSVAPGAIQAGATSNLTFTFTPGPQSILPGGKVSLHIPYNYPPPTISGGSTLSGYISVNAPSNGATVSSTISGNDVILTVTGSTPLVTSAPLVINYSNIYPPCPSAGSTTDEPFLFSSQQTICGQLRPLTAGSPTVTVSQGTVDHIGFNFHDMPVQLTNIYPVQLTARDVCNTQTAAPGSFSVNVAALKLSGGNFVADTEAVISLNSNLSSPFTGAAGSVNFQVGDFSKTFYYALQTNTVNTSRRIQSNHPIGTYSYFDSINITPVTSGITNLSVDTGALQSGQTSLTFTPDGDGTNDVVYINFTLPLNLPYQVELSSDNFSTIARRFYGFGRSERIPWYGDLDGFSINGPLAAPAGTYAVRIHDESNTLTDQSLSITLSAGGITGLITDSNGNILDNVDIELFNGPLFRFGRTDSMGRYTIYGIKPGSYTLRTRRSGFLSQEVSVTIPSGLLTQSTIILQQSATLKLHFSRPSNTYLPEIWGGLNANNSNWTSYEFSSVHFSEGQTESDAGDFWNAIPSSYSILNLNPGVSYTIRLDLPGYGMTPITTSITGPQEQTIALSRRPDISGLVSVPSGSNPNGIWISVEACLDADTDQVCDSQDPSLRFYGGSYLYPGSTDGVHLIAGVNNGTYLLVAQAPGFIRNKINVTVSGGVDVTNADFPVFGTGGSITGTLTINGDTEALDFDNDGLFTVPLNCWSPTSFQGSFVEVTLSTHATQTTASYSLSGLEDDTYQIFINVEGFEVTPGGILTATVSGGTATKNITLQQFSGSLVGDITLPGSAVDYANVELDLLSQNGFSAPLTTQPDSNGHYVFNQLGTGYYTLRANYSTTGYQVEKSVVISNGSSTTKDLDLSGTTYSLTGTVSTLASSPYNTLDYLVNGTTPTSVYNFRTNSTESIPANRIVAERVRDNQFFDPNQQGGSIAGYDPRRTYYGAYDASGNYSIPHLSPGIYRIFNNAELNDDMGDGNEISEISHTVYIDSNKTQDFDLTDGAEISGSIVINSGQSETSRNIQVNLRTNQSETIARQDIVLTGTSANFQLFHVPDGDYILSMQDDMFPLKYVSQSVSVRVEGADVSGKTIRLLSPARIQGSLRIATSGELLTTQNFDRFLAESFRIEAKANPWTQGGFGFANYPLIDTTNKFNIYVLAGTYDLTLKTDGFIGETALAEGKKQFINKTITGLSLIEGQTVDVGTIDLEEGVQIRGTVTDTNSNPLSNILVYARPSGNRRNNEPISATTNHLGQFSIYGADPARTYDVTVAPRPDRRDPRFQNFEGSRYGEVLRKNVSPVNSNLSFQLELAQGSIVGRVVTPDNGSLNTPFESDPGASVIVNPVGNTPNNNPLGDIEVLSLPDGTFLIDGLVAGSYNLYALAENYANGIRKNIVVGSGATNIGDVSLSSGATLSGSLVKTDNSLPSLDELNGLIAVRSGSGFDDLIIARLDEDAAGNISGYHLSGFKQDRTYDIVYFDQDDELSLLTSGITVNTDTQLNFTLGSAQTPRIITQVRKNSNNTITLKYEFTKALRNSQIDLDSDDEPDDNELDERFTVLSGAGTLSVDINDLSSDRKRFRMTYTPASGETSFSIRSDVTFNVLDSNGNNITLTQDNTYFIGIGASASEVITNINGGGVELEDGSEFTAQSGTFGENTNQSIEVVMRAADDTSHFAGINGASGHALSLARELGMKAYPTGMAAAMSKAMALGIDPFSSFYDIFLPVGVSHFFPTGKEAEICLNYDSSATDPYSLNIYYFNEATNEYLLEQTNKTVDVDNQRICAQIAHASIFTILNSSDAIITGGGYTGELALLNFPNPFDLKQKNVTLQDPGSVSASQTIDGTMIKMSIPSSLSGDIQIQIFNAVGEKVRTLETTVTTGGAHFYMEWDGRNDHGEKVASGTYIGRFTISGSNEKFFKMAVLK